MADLKISQLPNASTPLAGTEMLPIVQAGVTDKVTVDNLLARLTAAPPAIGTTTPAAGSFTTLAASGNVTLGDASTDTLNVGNGGIVKNASGLVSINTGGANGPAVGLTVNQGTQVQGTTPQFQWYSPAAASGLKYQRLVSDGAGVIALQRVNDAYNVATELLKIDASNNVTVVSPAGLGYGVGAGGTATQPTNKGGAVSIDRPTGLVTLNAASLAAATTVSFSFFNSLLTGTDMLIFQPVSDGVIDPSNYQIWGAVATTGGSAQVMVRNISAAPLAEALKVRFAIIKSASA